MLKCHRLNGRVQWERTFEDGILSVASVAGRRHYLWVHTRSGIVHVIPSEGDEHATVGTVEKVHCGKFTFCRMHHLQYHGNNQHPRNLVALPSQITSDAIDVWDADQCIVLVSAIQPTTIPTSSASSSPSSTVAITRGNDQCGIVMCVRLIVSAIKGDDGGVNNDLVLLTGTDDGVLRAYRLNLEAGTYQQILRLKIFPQTITCLDYNHETQSVALGGPRSDLVLLKGVFDDEQRLVMRTCVANEGFSELCFSSSGRLLVTGGWDGK